MESPLPPKPTPQLPAPSPNTPIQFDHRPVQTTLRPFDICFRCHQAGHWSRNCPSNNKSRSHVPQISNFPNIYCRCGHGFCEVRTAKNGRNPGRSYYVCPIERGKKCRDFVKWCDESNESDLRPPLYKYPSCSCGAGVCRRVKATSGSNKGRYFFACPIRKDYCFCLNRRVSFKQGHGACSHCVWEDTLQVIPNIEVDDLLDIDIVPNFGDDQDMDVDITSNTDDPQDTDIPDVDDSQELDKEISRSWESLSENARLTLHQIKPSTSDDLRSLEEQIQNHEEEEENGLANMITANNFIVDAESSYIKAKAEFGASQQRSRSRREEAARLKKLLEKIEGEIILCELQIQEMESRMYE